MMSSKPKAKLLFRDRLVLKNGWLRDAIIWEVPVSESYPEGYRYRLVLAVPLTKEVLLLFDNHYPKGHHLHLKDGSEIRYHFQTIEKLMLDYLDAIQKEMTKI